MLRKILSLLIRIDKRTEKMDQAVTDLQAVVAQFSTDVQAAIKAITDLQNSGQQTQAIETAVASLKSLDASLNAAVAPPAAPAAPAQ